MSFSGNALAPSTADQCLAESVVEQATFQLRLFNLVGLFLLRGKLGDIRLVWWHAVAYLIAWLGESRDLADHRRGSEFGMLKSPSTAQSSASFTPNLPISDRRS